LSTRERDECCETVRLVLRPSRLLGAGIAGLHGLALAPLWAAGIAAPLAWFVTALVICSGVAAVCRHALLADRGSAVAIGVDSAHRCDVFRRDGSAISGNVAGTTLVTGRLAIVAVRVRRWRPLLRIAIVPDMVDSVQFRAFRVLLKWAPAGAAATDGRVNG
jgi:hypothetical protein